MAGIVKPSHAGALAVWYGWFNAWVESEVLPAIESGALDATGMIVFVPVSAAGRKAQFSDSSDGAAYERNWARADVNTARAQLVL